MPHPAHCRTRLLAAATLLISLCHAPPVAAAPEDDVRAAFDQFVRAQNAHDLTAVEGSLLSTPDFLWITRGAAVWGQEAAVKRFAALYGGTWRLEPETSNLKVIMLGEEVAQIFVPITFAIGAAGGPPQQAKFLMNQILVRRSGAWKVSSILPIPVPAP